MHKHGNKFYVLGSGIGPFPYKSVAEAQAAGIPFNLATAPFVDGFTSTPNQGAGTWMVFRYQANTPGAWFFHCHVQTHFSGGMAVAILDGVDQFPTVPKDAGEVCPGTGSTGHSCYEAGKCSGCGSWEDGVPTYDGYGSGNATSSSGSDSGSGGFYTGSASAGYPSATATYSAGSGPATYTSSAGIATYTGAATVVKTTTSSVFGLLAVFFAMYV